MHLVYFPKFCITIIFDFSWDDCNTQEKLETVVMQNFRGQTRCIMVYVKMVNTGISNFFAYFKFHSDWGRVIGKIKQNELDCRDTAPFMCQREARGSCAAEQGRVNTWDRDELGALWVRIALHTFLFMRGLPGISLKTNSERSDFVSVADPTRVIFVPVRDCTGLM